MKLLDWIVKVTESCLYREEVCLKEAFMAFVLALALMGFKTTRLWGVLLGALFVYRFPLAALMIAITILVLLHLFFEWRSKHEQSSDRGLNRSARLGSTRRGTGRGSRGYDSSW